jgi:hypothetical protein
MASVEAQVGQGLRLAHQDRLAQQSALLTTISASEISSAIV